MADALHEAMKQRPEGATRTDLHGALGRNRPAAEIDRALTALVRAEKAVMREQKEGRHVTEIWTPASRAGGTVKGGRYLQRAREVLAG